MATWVIETAETKKAKEAEDRERLGADGVAERKRIAAERAEELDWKEAMFTAPQFESIALGATDAVWNGTEGKPGLKDRDGEFWWKLLSRLVAG